MNKGLLLSSLPLAACATADGAQPGTAYRAIGQEPGWTVTITDRRIDYVGDYGETRISVPVPSPRTTFNGHRYKTERLIVDVTHVRCADAMSGRGYADQVLVIADGKEVRGCGGEPLPPEDFADTRWRIVAIDGETVPNSPDYYLAFENGMLSGKAGCNVLGGPYQISGGRITPGTIIITTAGCVPGRYRFERRLLQLVSRPFEIDRDGSGRWVLSSSEGSVILKLL